MAEEQERPAERARHVQMLVMDVDGVLTDGKVLYGDQFEGVLFNVHDGTGIKYLHRSGIRTAIITGRDMPGVRARAESLGIEHVIQGAKVKLDAYDCLLQQTGLDDRSVAYIGDDLTDIPVMLRVRLAVAVPNASEEVFRFAHMVTGTPGGEGAVREVAEFILKAQEKWQTILARYLQSTETE